MRILMISRQQYSRLFQSRVKASCAFMYAFLLRVTQKFFAAAILIKRDEDYMRDGKANKW